MYSCIDGCWKKNNSCGYPCDKMQDHLYLDFCIWGIASVKATSYILTYLFYKIPLIFMSVMNYVDTDSFPLLNVLHLCSFQWSWSLNLLILICTILDLQLLLHNLVISNLHHWSVYSSCLSICIQCQET